MTEPGVPAGVTSPSIPIPEAVMKSESSIEIDRPIEDVFRLTNDHVADWSIIVVEDDVVKETPDRVGTTFRTVTEERGQRMVFEGVITRHDPPHLNAVHLKGDSFDIDAEYTFEDLSGRTRVTQRSSVTPKGWFKVILFLFGWLMKKSSCKALNDELASLKRFCEKQPSSVSR